MEDKTRENITDGSIWTRGLHMVLFAIAYNVVEAMLGLTAVFQFFCALITGRVNEPLLRFAKNGSIYVQEVMEFLTFNSEIRPFPFTEWPNEEHTGHEWLGEDGEVDAEVDVDLETASPVAKVSIEADSNAAPDSEEGTDHDPQPKA